MGLMARRSGLRIFTCEPINAEIVEVVEMEHYVVFDAWHVLRGPVKDIAEWWPVLHEQIRRVLVNGIWMPVSEFARSEIERLGGPGSDDAFWVVRDGERCLPGVAVQWIIETTDFKKFVEPPKPDPRAAYFRRGWPHRQP